MVFSFITHYPTVDEKEARASMFILKLTINTVNPPTALGRFFSTSMSIIGHFVYCDDFLASTKHFSSLLRSSQETPKWDTYLDKYYSIVCPSMCSIVICPCSFIVSKCLIFPYDEKYSICTPIELELEHD